MYVKSIVKAVKNKLIPFPQDEDRGFTLIEILVVFSVIAVLSGIGVASFSAYSRSQQLAQSSNNIKLLINEARFNSLSGVKITKDPSGNPVSCGNESLIGYKISLTGTNQVRLSLECQNLNSQTVKILTLPNGYTFGTGTTCTQLRFDSLLASPSGVPCAMVIVGYGLSKTITIDAMGNSSIQ